MGTGEARERDLKWWSERKRVARRESHPAQRTFEEGRKGLQRQMPQIEVRTDGCPPPQDLAPAQGSFIASQLFLPLLYRVQWEDWLFLHISDIAGVDKSAKYVKKFLK